MALRDQPYLPLFIQDFMTDEQLADCSAAANGVMIRLMCILHKEPCYGKARLKEKYRISDDILTNFSTQFSKNMPYEIDVIRAGLQELLNEKVIRISGDTLSQKRMVRDGELSDKRSKVGKIGGKKTAEINKKFATGFAEDFASAKVQANTENENEYVSEIKTSNTESKEGGVGKGLPNVALIPRMMQLLKEFIPYYPEDQQRDYPACQEIAQKIAKHKGWPPESITNGRQPDVEKSFARLIKFASADKWFQNKDLPFISNHFANLILSINSKPKSKNERKINSGGVNGTKPRQLGITGYQDISLHDPD